MSAAQIASYGKKFPILLRTPSPKGQVELIETVGKGNYGYVYKGRLIGSNEISAVKVVFLKEDELKETLLEMEILKACSHPNVTRYMGLFLKGLDLWICMEFCGGGALDSIYRAIKKPFNEDQIGSIIYDSIVGLEYLHNQVALIHRDIKAGNLLLTEAGELKLADFGVSAKLKSSNGTARTFIGTPYWMAPEVIACDPESATSQTAAYDCKSDIWSIGITAIEIADKNPPLSDIHPMRALHMIPSSNLGLAKPKNWSKQFVDFIASCLVKDPARRPSAREILQHPFMQKAAGLPRQQIMCDLVKKAKIARERKKAGLEPLDDEEDEQEKKQAVPEKVLHETMKVAKQAQLKAQQTLAAVAANVVSPGGSAPPTVPQAITAAPAPNEVFRPSMLGADFPGFIEEGSVSNRVLTPTAMGGIMRDIYGADILDGTFVLLATERGLYFNEVNTPRIEPIPLIRHIRFKQVQVLSDYNVLIALSGKHNHIRQYKLSSIRKLIHYILGMSPALLAKTNMDSSQDGKLQGPEQMSPEIDDEYKNVQEKDVVEDEATLIAKWTSDYIKILATKDSGSFLIQRTESSIFMGVLFTRDVILFEWAKDPYLRFMKLKAFWLPELPKFMNLITDGLSVREVYMAYAMEANLVQVSDSKVIEVEVHREFMKNAQANGGGYRPRWHGFYQIPFSEAKRNELKSMSRPNNTVNRKLLAVTGPGSAGSTSVDRYFLATFHRLTRVVDIASQPMMGSGVGGWKDGVTWMEPPTQLVMRPVDQVIAVGKQTMEVADWRSAQILQVLKVDSSATIKILSDTPGSLLAAIDRGRKGTVVYYMKEKPKQASAGSPASERKNSVESSKIEADIAKLQIAQPQPQQPPQQQQQSQQQQQQQHQSEQAQSQPSNNKHRVLPDIPGQSQGQQHEGRRAADGPAQTGASLSPAPQSPRISAPHSPRLAPSSGNGRVQGDSLIPPPRQQQYQHSQTAGAHPSQHPQHPQHSQQQQQQQQPANYGQQPGYAQQQQYQQPPPGQYQMHPQDPRYPQYYAQQQQQYQYYMAQQQQQQLAYQQGQPQPQVVYDPRYAAQPGAQYLDPRYAGQQYQYYAQGPPPQGYQQPGPPPPGGQGPR
ncbi:hypothetical protein HDU77_008785 [Chytriomyces hyalinus]|nr:hypothetical protein HDU77_008785 [Chytriomyces hyalinus]